MTTETWSVPTRALSNLVCPLSTPPWDGAVGCLKGAVWRALKSGERETAPIPEAASINRHAARIAHLMETGWDDPISIEIGVPSMPGWQMGWPIWDGNHRLAAAILSGREHILITPGGSLACLAEMLNIPLPHAD